ncbi:MAG: hypothetical protein ACM3S5_18780 [Rhodospirillales bacterium]
MATETIYKLQPTRTMHLRGFERRGAAAALHSASETGFTVSGVFRDMADFAVLVLWDADDFFEHLSMRYLPDFDFSGMKLTFDVHYDGLQPIDSVKWNWIDWATLDVMRADGTTVNIRLFDHATLVSGEHKKAKTSFLLGSSLSPWTHVTLWYENIAFDWWGDGSHTPTVTEILQSLADQINGHSWSGIDMPITATVDSANGKLIVEAGLAGEDGNHIQLYARTNGVTFGDPDNAGRLVGGSSDVTWRVTIDFTDSALRIDKVRQMWMTFAPKLPIGAAYSDTEWSAVFTNWTVEDPQGKRALKVAGPGSVRVTSKDDWVKYSGTGWAEESGWYAKGYAHRSKTTGDKVRVRYACQFTHDVWIGTSLYKDRGKADVAVDGVPVTDPLDCYVPDEPAILSRRCVKRSVPAGEHVVEITVRSDRNPASSDNYVYFDYLHAVVASDVPDAPVTYTTVSPALDFDTDHTYKMPPQRLVWNLDRMGFHGDVNEYVGVFWWNQRKRVAGRFQSVNVTFNDDGWGYGGAAWLQFGGTYQGDPTGTKLGKTFFPTDAAWIIADHFAAFINETMVGVWATSNGNVLTITALSPLYDFPFWAWTDNSSGKVGTITVEGDLRQGSEGIWEIDAAATPTLNRAATDWHRDFFAAVQSKGWTATASFSMELLNPPDDPENGQVWAARFRDGVRVLTATGFGTEALCRITGATNASPIEITAKAHGYETGDSIIVYGVEGNTGANSPLDASGNRVPWIITRTGADTFTLAGSSGTGAYTGNGFCERNLKTAHCAFVSKVTDYQKNVYKEMAGLMADAGLTPWLQFGEYLWWFFTNYHATQNPGGGMAYYDADTATAAQTALGRPLAVFQQPTDDPGVNSYADANFLRQRIKDHCDAISAFVKATYAAAKFEVLWPYDVNYPTPTRLYSIGGRLNRYVNLPSQWQTKAGSGLDRIKMEGLAFGSSERDFDKAKETITLPYAVLSWPKADTRYMLPWFNGGCPWDREYLFTLAEGTPHVNLWAFDHLCLMTWPMPLPSPSGNARAL